jgi:predicted DNA-binding protein
MIVKLDEVLQLQVLKLKALTSGQSFSGRLMDQLIEQSEGKVEVRNMCAKVAPELYERLEQVCSLLDMTKRQFIEAAVNDACSKAEDLIERHGALPQQGEL